ncbi:LOW QUALITY PROTEIN: hypothetical protein V2J09_010375 [Rumex salicifolius]
MLLRVPYYLGELTEKFLQDDRIQEFISFCEPLELVPQKEIETSLQGGTNVLADQRARKIVRFKRQRAAESKLPEIKERKERRGRSTRAAALSTPVDERKIFSDDDGEEERENGRLSEIQWAAFILLCAGCTTAQLTSNSDHVLQTPLQGWVMVVIMALLSGFAGVYTEAIIKKRPQRNINVQNFWLYVFGMAFNAAAILIHDFDKVVNE